MSNKHSTGDLRRSLNLVIIAIAFGMVFFTVINGPALTAYTRMLGAGDLVYSIIMAMPVLGGVFQVIGSFLIEKTGKRKTLMIVSGFLHRLLLIPVALVPVFIPSSNHSLRIMLIAILLMISSIGNAFCGVAFSSWMGSLVPSEIRGRFFSKRTQIYTISSIITALIVGRILDAYPSLRTFSVIFIVISIIGAIDIVCFLWVKHPPMNIDDNSINFIKLIKEPFTNRNYMLFIIFVSVFSFGVNFAGPFFNVYMIEYLKMEFFTISLYGQVISSVSTILFIKLWGKLIDLYGNKPVQKVCSTAIVLLPAAWLFVTPNTTFIILIINFFGGLFWSGYELTILNLSIWLAPEKNRSIYVAVFTLITSVIGIALAFVCGGAVMEYTKPIIQSLKWHFIMQPLNSFHILLILSASIRLCSVLFIAPKFYESGCGTSYEVLKGFIDMVKQKVNFRIKSKVI